MDDQRKKINRMETHFSTAANPGTLDNLSLYLIQQATYQRAKEIALHHGKLERCLKLKKMAAVEDAKIQRILWGKWKPPQPKTEAATMKDLVVFSEVMDNLRKMRESK